MAAGLASMGVETFGIHGASPEEYQQHLTETLKCHPNLVIDDGGDLIDLLGGPVPGVRGLPDRRL